MTSAYARAALVVAAAALAACGDDPFQRSPLRVAARSGATVDLSGTTWGPVCVEGALVPLLVMPPQTQSTLRRIVHGEDGAVSYSYQPFGQPACAGTALADSTSITWLATADGNRAVTWSGAKPVDAFPDAPLATRVFLENVAVLGEVFWLDDQSSPRVLYASPDDSPPDPNDGYPAVISAGGFVEIP